MRTRRPTAVALGLVAAVVALTGCRTSPGVAAYVGDDQVTVEELQAEVDERLADPVIAEAAAGSEADYTRQVLTLLLRERVYAVAEQRYDVEVTDGDVDAFVAQALAGQDAEALFAQAAAQGFAREDVLASARQQLVRRELAAATGEGGALDEAALRARYEEVRGQFEQVELGYLVVPDQATADAVVAELTADPASYPAVAARFPGEITLPALQPTAVSEVPAPLVQGVTAATPNSGFTVTVPDVPGVVVAFVGQRATPSFEEVRTQLESEAATGVEEAGTALVDDVRTDLGITVNPRYGSLEDDVVQVPDGGVVDLLDDGPAAADPTATGSGG
ncbi:peptidyl-prolyl cis-trans isomerase SurA [Geodermatophilus bullaregiensis]|uniref:SurA N-terminal domain-containing protein n=1 Tax=Geodermatophilus bullaregiensis TaxID=1564160 RepID=UPI00195E016D|nr:SurA N-terminal domain-containing protein [Geodermatophilus bullaregiensis]MBM7807390.1 peptidyl-prolyl cis-trans isomerase SurA [Geodermatophilus bullaregiensis]